MRANGNRGETTQGANGIRGETTRYQHLPMGAVQAQIFQFSNLLTLSVLDEGYSKHKSCTPQLFTLLFTIVGIQIFWHFMDLNIYL
jgi:hypothetical protein